MTNEQKQAALDALQMVCDAFKEIKVYGVDELIGKIRAAISAPAVLVKVEFENKYEDWIVYQDNGYNPDFYSVVPKMQKVDLSKTSYPLTESCPEYCKGYNAAIDDIKAKYGELYAEVKE